MRKILPRNWEIGRDSKFDLSNQEYIHATLTPLKLIEHYLVFRAPIKKIRTQLSSIDEQKCAEVGTDSSRTEMKSPSSGPGFRISAGKIFGRKFDLIYALNIHFPIL